ncbi:TPA: hypothetical protein ACH9I5_000442 [Escherichia coli]|uniref:hypothetical protein n=1 Tax=Escherichia coli TaxID=562 RepID=UPI00050B2335|nr:hypothetical protein [Escherichia coli]MEB6149491.1 hypothetical protein [Escherichia coli]
MMWNFDSADLSAIAAGISAFGTLAAAGAALASWCTSKKALQLQNRVYLYESLKACAERANSSAKDKRGSEWSVNDAADIIRCLVRAMELIKQDSQQKEGNQALMLKQYFVNLLIMELYEEVHNGDAADSVFKSTEPTQVLDNLWSKWQEAIAFFDIWNYPVATEEDLAD